MGMGKTINRMWTPNIVYMVHGSYNLEKVLNFTSGLEKYLTSLLGLEKSFK